MSSAGVRAARSAPIIAPADVPAKWVTCRRSNKP